MIQGVQTTPAILLSRILDEVLDDYVRQEDFRRWWQWRLRQHDALGTPPQPEFDILRGLDTFKRPRNHRRLRRNVGGDPIRFRAALQGLWAAGMISSQQETRPASWEPGIDVVITLRGKHLLGRLRQLHLRGRSEA